MTAPGWVQWMEACPAPSITRHSPPGTAVEPDELGGQLVGQRLAGVPRRPLDHQFLGHVSVVVLVRGFNPYLDQEHADPTADSVGYIQVPLWLSQGELAELIDEIRAALLAKRDNKATQDRRPYLASPILFPLVEPGQREHSEDLQG